MIYIYSAFILFTGSMLYAFLFFTYKKVSIEYKTLLLYTVGLTILPGVILAPYLQNISDRLINISLESTIIVAMFTIYYLFIFIIPIYLWAPRKDSQVKINSYENTAAKLIFFLSLLYLLIRIYLFYENIPLFYLLNNDLINAAKYRQLTQNKIILIDIPYIGAVFKILTSITVYYFFFQWVRNNKYSLYFISSLFVTFLYLMLDTQKAPIFIVLINLFVIYLSLKKINLKLLVSISLSIVLLLFLVVSLNGSDDILNSLYSIYDRIIMGQVQSMYYMFEFLTPNADSITYDFYFSSLMNNTNLPPNIKIIPYIPLYEGNDTLVNVNTFYLGDVWGYFGWFGLIFAPWVVFIIFTINILILKKLRNNLLYIFLCMSFLSFYPLNRSFSEILFSKYLLHYIIFGFVPLMLIISFCKKIKVR